MKVTVDNKIFSLNIVLYTHQYSLFPPLPLPPFNEEEYPPMTRVVAWQQQQHFLIVNILAIQEIKAIFCHKKRHPWLFIPPQ